MLEVQLFSPTPPKSFAANGNKQCHFTLFNQVLEPKAETLQITHRGHNYIFVKQKTPWSTVKSELIFRNA